MDFNLFFSNILRFLFNVNTLFLVPLLVAVIHYIIVKWYNKTYKQLKNKHFVKNFMIILIPILIFILVGIQSFNNSYSPQRIYSPATNGSLLFYDPLTAQDDKQWEEKTDPGFTCEFKDGSYHAISVIQNDVSLCLAHASPSLDNFAFQVQMTILQGDAGGLTFNANGTSDFYRFTIHSNGFYELFIFQSSPSRKLQTLLAGNIFFNQSQPNLLGVRVYDGHIYLYVNGQNIAEGGEDTYEFGQIGVFGYSVDNPTDVAFNNAQMWVL